MRFFTTTTMLLAGILFWPVYSVYYLNKTAIYAENGLLETLQALTLVASCLVFLLPTMKQERGDKLILLFFSWLCFSFILREIDVEDFDLPSAIIFIGSGIGRNILLAISLLVIVTYGLLNISYYKKRAKQLIASKEGLLIMSAAILLQTGAFFEKSIPIEHHTLWEELFELSAYAAILFSAMILYKKIAPASNDNNYLTSQPTGATVNYTHKLNNN